MNSKIYIGHVEHHRYHPVEHHLRYPVYMYGIDPDELPKIDQSFRLFGYNRIRPTSIHDIDYLTPGSENIKAKVQRCFRENGVREPIDRVFLITSARYFNYVFNPVNFHYCFSKKNDLVGIIAEVNNTYGEKHLYLLTDRQSSSDHYPAEYTMEKQFHVSPFNNLEGVYHFFFSDVQDNLEIRIQLIRNQQKVFEAQLTASSQPLTPFFHIQTLVKHPIAPHLSIPRIYLEAFKLYFSKKLAFHDKPVPKNPMTFARPLPGVLEGISRRILFSTLKKITRGHVNIRLPDGKVVSFGRPDDAPDALLDVKDHGFFFRVLTGGSIGLGESYTEGQWDTPDLVELFKRFIDNRDILSNGNLAPSVFTQIRERLHHHNRKNTLAGSRRNIVSHYDLGNDFYRLFLDDRMIYSCAIFRSSQESLDQAQTNKMHAIIEKARLSEKDHVLEIGCGWGGFAMEAVKQTGCRVTGITVSEAQFEYAQAKVREEGLERNITIKLEDYRNITGCFDKIVSIEMIEAVGKSFLGTFFKRCDQLLKPDGLMVLQTITIPDHRYKAYSKERDWIQKHIFSGGHLPSITALTHAMTGHSKFGIEHLENIGFHYVLTLQKWRRQFYQNSRKISDLGFSEAFLRKWNYYFSICEACFARHVLGDIQMVLSRPGNHGLNVL
jgi:cyclopropane-fatty-acyl-phospholipid synthase